MFNHNYQFATIAKRLSLLGVMGILAGCNATSSTQTVSSSASYGSQTGPMKICSGYGCVISNQMTFGPDDFKTLSRIMKAGAGSPAAERKAIKSAISYMEKTTRNSLRYSADTAFSYQKHAGKRGQMDCVDESLNTTAYLKYLSKNGLLKHHTPISNYASRGLLIDGRYPHKSARMKQKGGQVWAVDSWKSDNGGQPEIMPLSVWYKDKNSASDYR